MFVPDFYEWRPNICVLLSCRHRAARLQCYQERISCSIDHWSNVLFTEESDSFRIRTIDKFLSAERLVHGIMGWISFSATRFLFVSSSGLEFLLKNVVTPISTFLHEIYCNWPKISWQSPWILCLLLCRSNMVWPCSYGRQLRLHSVNIVIDYLIAEVIQIMKWPTYSSHLNPIKHVWEAFGRNVASSWTSSS